MWYLITFEEKDFVTLKVAEADTNFRYKANGEDLPTITVSAGKKDYSTELRDEYAASDYGAILCALQTISPGNFMVINFSCVLLKWEDSIAALSAKVSELTDTACKFTIFQVTGQAASNMPQGFLMAINHALK